MTTETVTTGTDIPVGIIWAMLTEYQQKKIIDYYGIIKDAKEMNIKSGTKEAVFLAEKYNKSLSIINQVLVRYRYLLN